MIIKGKIEERSLNKEHILRILTVVPAVFLVFGIVMGILEGGIVHGYMEIIKSPTILITDFLELGGIGPAFINAGIIGLFSIYLLYRFKMKINGLIIAALMTLIGFSFFGKNPLNIMPLYIGGYLYARHEGIHMRDVIVVIMFSTGLSPIISELMFAGILPTPFNYIIGLMVGVLIGFVIAPLSSSMLKFHDGYNLYNIGFTAGIVGTVFTSILRSFDKVIEPVSIIYQSSDLMLKGLFFTLFVYFITVGLWINNDSIKKYKRFSRYTGRTVTDYTYLLGYGMAFTNMGIMGLLSIFYVTIVGGKLNGPVIAAVFTVVGFAAFGKYLWNCIPVMAGVILAALGLGLDLSSTGILISVLFSTTIAPIAGAFGVYYGILAGMLHMALVTNIGIIHGGINLYNNGFSGGLVAGFLVPIIEAFRKGD